MTVLGITGPIASGKTTAAALFRAAGIPVFDADASVRELYEQEPEHIAGLFPEAIVDGRVDRRRLSQRVMTDPPAFALLEATIHPLVRQRMEAFLVAERERGTALAIVEVPLLYETAGDRFCDKVLLMTAPVETRRARVAMRGTMSEAMFERLDDRQIPPDEKAERADFVVDSDRPIADVEADLRAIMASLLAMSAGGEG